MLRDTSAEAVTPALGYAANVITIVTLVFFALVMFIFWLGGLGEKGKAADAHGHAAPVIAGGSGRAEDAARSMRVPVGVKVGLVSRSS